MNPERNDAIFSEILNEHGSISSFFDSVFGFLARRTDFYCEMTCPSDEIGFPPGTSVNEQIVLKTLRKCKNSLLKSANDIPVACEKEITTTPIDYKVDISSDVLSECHDIKNEKICPTFEPSEFYNGACFDNYCWSQSINQIELNVLLPEHATSSKHLHVSVGQLSVKVIDQRNQVVLLDESLVRKWKASESTWSIAGKKLQITVDKMTEAWWDKLFTSEPSLDTTKLNCSRPMEEMPQYDQSEVQKILWDNKQNLLGKPTSKKLQEHEMLKRAWNVEGSPFKGTPFDPNVVTFQN